MRQQIAVVICSVVLGLMTLSPAAIAQQKTAKECREEWRANKTANQANGVTEKAYVAQCRAGGAPTQTTVAPAPAPTVPDPTPTATPTVPAAPVPTTASPATTAPAPTAAAPTEAAPPIRPIRPIRPVRPLPE